jgi:hypothetical protein
MGSYHETKYVEELLKFIDVERIINTKLIFTNPLVEVIKREINGKGRRNT